MIQCHKMLTIITPCSRRENLCKVYESIHFEKIHKWIIVYDTSKQMTYTKLFQHDKILETECSDFGISGNAQRNFGASLVLDGHIYFLDDDTIVHPEFWNLQFDNEYFYTFDQYRCSICGWVLYGNDIRVNRIDTAMFVVPKHMFSEWDVSRYDADGYFITKLNILNPGKHIYCNVLACYYNYLNPTAHDYCKK